MDRHQLLRAYYNYKKAVNNIKSENERTYINVSNESEKKESERKYIKIPLKAN